MDWKRELEKAIANGDRDGYVTLLGRFYDEAYPRLFAYCRKEASKEIAEDAINDVFVTLIENPKPILQAESLFNYILKMATNRSKNSYKECVSPLEVLEEDVPAKEDGTSRSENILDRAKGCLDDGSYKLLLLRCVYHYSFKEIGDSLGIGEDAAAYRYKTIIKKLRRLLR